MHSGDDFIKNFMENITSQTIFESHCELIMINANSPDSEEVVIKEYMQKYPNNIKYEKLDKDPGIYAVWNRAIEMSTGEYITNANLDDIRREDCIELQAKTLYNNTEVGLVFNDNYQTRDPNMNFFSEEVNTRYISTNEVTFDSLLRGNAPHNSPMWRKDIHDKYGKFDEQYRSAGDWDMWLRATKQGMKIKKIHIPLGLYYFNPKGISTNKENDSWKREEEQSVIMKHLNKEGKPL